MQLAFRAAAADDAMELYASGFNAWNQLIFEPSMIEEEPDDLHVFTKVLGAQTISRPLSHLCYTVGTQCLDGLSSALAMLIKPSSLR